MGGAVKPKDLLEFPDFKLGGLPSFEFPLPTFQPTEPLPSFEGPAPELRSFVDFDLSFPSFDVVGSQPRPDTSVNVGGIVDQILHHRTTKQSILRKNASFIAKHAAKLIAVTVFTTAAVTLTALAWQGTLPGLTWGGVLRVMSRLGLEVIGPGLIQSLRMMGVAAATHLGVSGLIALGGRSERVRSWLNQGISADGRRLVFAALGITIPPPGSYVTVETVMRSCISTAVGAASVGLPTVLVGRGLAATPDAARAVLVAARDGARRVSDAILAPLTSGSAVITTPNTINSIIEDKVVTSLRGKRTTVERQTTPSERGMLSENRRLAFATCLAGGLAATLLAASASPEAIGEVMRSMGIEGVVDATTSAVLKSATTLAENRAVQQTVYGIISQTVGIPRFIERIAGAVTPDRVRELTAIHDRREAPTLESIRRFFAIAIGERVYSLRELEDMETPALKALVGTVDRRVTRRQLITSIVERQNIVLNNLVRIIAGYAFTTTASIAGAAIVESIVGLSVPAIQDKIAQLRSVRDRVVEEAPGPAPPTVASVSTEQTTSPEARLQDYKTQVIESLTHSAAGTGIEQALERIATARTVEEIQAVVSEIQFIVREDIPLQTRAEVVERAKTEFRARQREHERTIASAHAKTLTARADAKLAMEARLAKRQLVQAKDTAMHLLESTGLRGVSDLQTAIGAASTTAEVEAVVLRLGSLVVNEGGSAAYLPEDYILESRFQKELGDISFTPASVIIAKQIAKSTVHSIPGVGWVMKVIDTTNAALETAETATQALKVTNIVLEAFATPEGSTYHAPLGLSNDRLAMTDRALSFRLPSLTNAIDRALAGHRIDARILVINAIKDKIINSWSVERFLAELAIRAAGI